MNRDLPDHPPDDGLLQEACRDFRRAWDRAHAGGSPVVIDDFMLRPGDPRRATLAQSLILIDLQQRWRQREKVFLERYLQRFPDCFDFARVPLDLIQGEYAVRRQYDKQMELDEYRVRFPHQFAALAEALAQHTPASAPENSQAEPAMPSPPTSSAPSAYGTLAAPTGFRANDSLRDVQRSLESGTSEPLAGANRDDAQTRRGYRLLHRLGCGKFGEVWKAEAPGGVEVAVKVISFPPGHKMTQLELKALEAMKGLRHPFLLQVQAYWMDSDGLYIVMELGDETLQDLAERLAQNGERLSPQVLIGYMREACEAIDYLHSENILHRDIKPANLLVARGHVKVADFGIALMMGSDNLTVTATTMGTPLYMAPEIWQGRASPRSDQYSLVMTYAELRMGRPPYSAKSLAEVMNQHLTSRPDLDLLEPAEQQVVQKALAKKPNERYASCTEFARALESAVAARTSTGRRHAVPRPVRMLAAFSLIALAVVGAMGLLPGARSIWPSSTRQLMMPERISTRFGEINTFAINVPGKFNPNLDTIEVQALPDSGLEIQLEKTPIGAQCTLRTTKLKSETFWVNVNLLRSGQSIVERILEVQVLPPITVAIDNCQPVDGCRQVVIADRVYASELSWASPKGIRVPFVLIPPQSDVDDVPAFYIMKTKVWNDLFREYVQQPGIELHPETAWEHGARAGTADLPAADHPQFPVFRVHITDAERFANWIAGRKGRLPSAQQWDKAAGRGSSTSPGPFNVPREELTSELVAINRRMDGPMPVGVASADVSVFEVRDMAGNGMEWTRTPFIGEPVTSVIELEGQAVALRGSSYFQGSEPYTFDRANALAQDSAVVAPDIGFRVVIELLP